ncbi:MAG: Bacillopeptidase F [Calditrichaeota bacterium]|nr:Bacillopeptidase F [Calditrichota bacterium]
MEIHRIISAALAPLLIALAAGGQAVAEPLTAESIARLPADSSIVSLILMRERPDIDRLRELTAFAERDDRAAIVWRELDELAKRTQRRVRGVLEQEKRAGLIDTIRPLRLANGIVVEAKPAALRSLIGHTDVGRLIRIIPRAGSSEEGEAGPRATAELDSVIWHVTRIQAPECWAEGFSGEGVLVAVIDTGVNYLHVDLRDHLWDGGPEYPFHGYDFADDDLDPIDESGHGSGVAGILAGDGTGGVNTGVAPNATIMCLRVRQDLQTGVVTDAWLAQDFALEHGADVISMSLGWGEPGPEDRPIWRENYEVLEAAGIVCVKSAGNRRPSREPPDAISVPGDVPSPWRHPDEVEQGSRGGQITVGATNYENEFSEYSSPGPVTWQNVEPWNDWPYDGGEEHVGLIKPDIAAPGVLGVTLTHEDTVGYTFFSNTSMAQPHGSGTVAILLSKNYNLIPAQVDSLLQTTAMDLGPEGKDNNYGAGLIQALDALNATPNVGVAPGSAPDDSASPPGVLALDVIYPNPFNPWTTVRVVLTEPGQLRVSVFNSLGRNVRTLADRVFAAGVHELRFDATGLASGTYVVRAEHTGRRSVTRKATYTK